MALSSIVCLLPIILSLTVYDNLPEKVVIHWDIAGNPDNSAPKAVAAFGLPFFFLAVNLITKVILYSDPRKENTSKPIRAILEWLIPFLSITHVPIMLFIAMGAKIPVVIVSMVFTGILLIVSGNFLPKSRQGYVVGIRVPWTLSDTDNWNKTHRMAGYLWIIGGMALIILSFLSFESSSWVALILLILGLLVAAPVLYSYSLYRNAAGKTDLRPME